METSEEFESRQDGPGKGGRDTVEADARSNRAEEASEIERLTALLAAKDEEIAAKDEEMAAKDEEIAAKDEEIAAKDEEMAAKDEEIAAKDALIESQSIKCLLENMPSMTVNKTCEPSIKSNEEARKAVQKYRHELRQWKHKMKDKNLSAHAQEELRKAKPKHPGFHEPAKITVDLQFADSLGFDLVLENEKGCLITSKLSLEQTTALTLPHDNETSPRIYLLAAIGDIIRSYGLDARVIMEATLFSLRPDLVVVVYEGRIIFLVEVKNPSTAKKKVFEAETAAGQSFDYCSILKQCGIDQPFTLLSTYNESVVVGFEKDRESYLCHVSTALESLERGSVGKGKFATHSKGKPPASPTKPELAEIKLNSLSTTVEKMDVDADADEGDTNSVDDLEYESQEMHLEVPDYDYEGRAVVYSKVFQVGDLYKVLALVLASSLASADASKESVKALVPKEGESLHDRELCTLYDDSFNFQKACCAAQYNKAPMFKTGQKFHVLCSLGQGSKGRCILCCSSSGFMFAAKLFLLDSSVKYLPQDRQQEKEKEFNRREREAKEELDRWIKLSPRQCHNFCRVRKMNNTPALTMPFFPPIPGDKRKDALQAIRGCLNELANPTTAGGPRYVYREIRWRHFGCRWSEHDEMEITPLDLGSLVEADSLEDVKSGEKSVDGVIDSQIQELQARMGDEPISQPQPPLVGAATG